VIALLYPIPKIAILPLLYFFFGTGEQAKWAAVAIGVFFLMAINTEAGVRQIEPILLDVARAYRIRPATFYFRVLLPGALPNIYAGIKLSIGIAIVLAVASEFRLYAALVAVSLLGGILTYGLDLTERWAIPWRRERKPR
jgi:NitT/TauT family transport system permease protein